MSQVSPRLLCTVMIADNTLSPPAPRDRGVGGEGEEDPRRATSPSVRKLLRPPAAVPTSHAQGKDGNWLKLEDAASTTASASSGERWNLAAELDRPARVWAVGGGHHVHARWSLFFCTTCRLFEKTSSMIVGLFLDEAGGPPRASPDPQITGGKRRTDVQCTAESQSAVPRRRVYHRIRLFGCQYCFSACLRRIRIHTSSVCVVSPQSNGCGMATSCRLRRAFRRHWKKQNLTS